MIYYFSHKVKLRQGGVNWNRQDMFMEEKGQFHVIQIIYLDFYQKRTLFVANNNLVKKKTTKNKGPFMRITKSIA